MKEAFVEKKIGAKRLKSLGLINEILAEYALQGYTLTVRQIYYQMVARGYIANSVRSYKQMVSLIGDGRMTGHIDWAMIQDRNRETVQQAHWNSPADIVRAAAKQYRIDKWARQPYHIEVMVEKDALSGILLPVCQRLDIALTACKGYNSLSNMYEAGGRLWNHWNGYGRQQPVILYLGDHDPSGIDMTRDIKERLVLFSGLCTLQVDRLALNFNQVSEMNPPENPAKQTDSRYARYVEEFGESSWELDAVEPATLVRLVEDAVLDLRDDDLWAEAIVEENKGRAALDEFIATYGK